MKMALGLYEGPAHVGAMRVVASMQGLHVILVAAQGDAHADLVRVLGEGRDRPFPIVSTVDLADDPGQGATSRLFDACRVVVERFRPQALLVVSPLATGPSGREAAGRMAGLGLSVPVIASVLPGSQFQETAAVDETFAQIVRGLTRPVARSARVSCNILGPTALGFRHSDDVAEIASILRHMGVAVNAIAPMDARPADIARLGAAHFNVLLYPETAGAAARWLERVHGQPWTRTVPIGAHATQAFVDEVRSLAGGEGRVGGARLPDAARLHRRIRTRLTGKRVFVFGDGTHVMAATRVVRDELGLDVCGLGCYNREMARPVRALADGFGHHALISDDSLEVEAAIAELRPDLVLGTRIERDACLRLGIPAAVISAPERPHDRPMRHSPQMGFEGAKVLFDTWMLPLLAVLDDDATGRGRSARGVDHAAGASRHQEQTGPRLVAVAANVSDWPSAATQPAMAAALDGATGAVVWLPEAEHALQKLPQVLRGKARRNAESLAVRRGVREIDLATLDEAKAHHGR